MDKNRKKYVRQNLSFFHSFYTLQATKDSNPKVSALCLYILLGECIFD